MDAFKTAVTVSLPTYLAGLPIPTELAGFAALTSDQWFQLAPVLLVIIAHVLILTSFFTSGEASGKINKSIKPDEPKVVNTVEFTGDKMVFCRCWKSSKFPLCDGAHNGHNESCCDNVGPLIVTKGKK